MGWHLRKPTLIELLLLIAIIAVVVALILPVTKWAASGSIRFPVRVLVFDAVRGRPIANAHVGIFRAAPLDDLKSLEESPDEYDPTNRVRDDDSGTTSADGAVVINYEFRTGANYERPTMYAHLTRAWVSVKAEGYGSIVVPVRYESQPTATLRTQKEILVSVGLIPME
ncbi:MAG: hypothetical protein WKF77_22070 [Planctomycetaceae bacterium]